MRSSRLCGCILVLTLLTACSSATANTATIPAPATTGARATPISLPTEYPTQLPPSTTAISVTDTASPPTATPPPSPGYIYLEGGVADAGNWFLYASEILSMNWVDAPQSCDRYDFYISNTPSDRTIVGTDLDPSDGVSIEWQVPEKLSGAGFWGEADCGDIGVVRSLNSGDLYSGDSPPEGICVAVSSSIGAPDIFEERSDLSKVFAVLNPGAFVPVLERTEDGWYRIDARPALYLEESGSAPETGWISDRYTIKLLGQCDDLPVAS